MWIHKLRRYYNFTTTPSPTRKNLVKNRHVNQIWRSGVSLFMKIFLSFKNQSIPNIVDYTAKSSFIFLYQKHGYGGRLSSKRCFFLKLWLSILTSFFIVFSKMRHQFNCQVKFYKVKPLFVNSRQSWVNDELIVSVVVPGDRAVIISRGWVAPTPM